MKFLQDGADSLLYCNFMPFFNVVFHFSFILFPTGLVCFFNLGAPMLKMLSAKNSFIIVEFSIDSVIAIISFLFVKG